MGGPEWSSVAGRMRMKAVIFSAVLAGIVGFVPAVEQEGTTPVNAPATEKEAEDADDRAQKGSVGTRRDARTLTMSIPAPRGLITDRNGKPLAQSKVAYYLAFEFPQFKEADNAEILEWARSRIAEVEKLTEKEWTVSDNRLLEHYKDRRWLPFIFSSPLKEELVKKGASELMNGLLFHPVYLRHYPEGSTAAHIIGYVRSKGKLPTGPINYGDPLFEETWGQAGLEKAFDEELTGTSGKRNMIFDSDGSRLLDEMAERPRVGNTVVTTLNLDWQKRAEKVLSRSCDRGALVVIDVQTGEVLVMASRPTYDINVWVPTIGQKDFDLLRNDESKPMYGRAFQAAYPPASTFKPIVALAALTNGVITMDTLIDCPAKIKIGDTWMRNHSKYPEGKITVTRALARSNNVWFYQVGIKTRAQAFLSVAERLGFGKKTGLPLFNENPGTVPTDDLMRADLGRPITSGDTANFAIGQGRLQSTPLQVAQAMAGIANGRVLPQVRLIRQVQDEKGGVLSAPGPETRTELNLDPMAVAVVHQGMKDVVNASYGTGKRGSLSFTTVAGKTGTAQWMPNRELAWFTGFFPFENPRFAFVALYEGKLGETVSGGRLAAPMIRDFFEPLKNEIKPMIKPPARATIIVEGGEGAVNPDSGDEEGEWVNKPEGGVLRAVPVEPFDLEGGNAPPVAVIIEEPEWEEEEEEPEDDVPPAAVIIEEPEDIEEP